MSLRGAFSLLTICEVLRDINDAVQGTDVYDKVHPLLVKAEDMAKRMSRKLRIYNKKWDKDWWDENKDYEVDLRRRENIRHTT